MKKSYGTWIKTFLISSLVLAIILLGFNYTIDPLWNFSHSNALNNHQIGSDERQQKTNAVTANNFNYDTLLLGNSIVTFMNPEDLTDYRAFNYAVSGMEVEEYNDYIEYAKKRNGHDFDYIILGLTFGLKDREENKYIGAYNEPSYYINRATDPFYKFKSLFSIDTVKNSFNNAKISLVPSMSNEAYYNRNNIKDQKLSSESFRKTNIERQTMIFKEEWADPDRGFVSDQDQYEKLIKNNPNTEFIVYTTPSLHPILNLMEETNRLDDYGMWLQEVIANFDKVYDFNYLNSVTTNINYYYDALHITPEANKLIAQRIMDEETDSLPKDFGVLVTQENILTHLKYIEKRYALKD